jgi:basic amino acid/polyamine antiporter, APA family
MSSSPPMAPAPQPAQERDTGLVRALGLRGMTFNTVNLVVGASIFVLPATVAGVLGPAAVVAYVVCAVAMAFVALCFAEAGSRTSSTGGAYLYAETAFGPFAGYLVGVVMWFGSFMLGSAGIANVLVNAVGELFPALSSRAWHSGMLVALFAGLALANIRGAKTGAHLVEGLTVLKLAPLLLLIAVGVFAIEPANLEWSGVPSASMIANGSLVLVFAFMGLEMAVTPGGEIRDPARTVPRAILSALAIITALYIAIQLVAQGVLGAGLAENKTAPLAAVAEGSMGGGGRAIILIGTILSTFGYLAGDMLTSPRVLYAFGRDGHLPAFFGRVHPRFHTPHVAIVVHAAAAIGFALTGTFESLVVLSVVSTLIIYLSCAISVLVMRRRGIRAETPPFVTRGGPLVPILACALVLWLLSQATRAEFVAVGVMLGVAILLYFARSLFGRRAAAR